MQKSPSICPKAIRAILWIIALSVSFWRVAPAPEVAIPVTLEPIPLAGFKSWSLFLVCNPEWARPQREADVRALYERFQRFGEDIGANHVAVWLASQRRVPTRIDSARSARFCENLKLPQNDGPYVVLTGRYPGAALTDRPDTFSQNLGNHLVLSLNNLSAADTTQLLNGIATQLVSSELANQDTQSEQYWRSLQTAFQTSNDPLLKKVSVTFETAFFSTAIAHPGPALMAERSGQEPVATGATWSGTLPDNSAARLTAFVADRTSLQFDSTRRAYAGSFVVALQNLDRADDRSELRQPITIAVRAPGATAFTPAPVRITRLSEWMDVEVLVPDPRGARYPVSVSAGPNDRGNAIELDVNRPRVTLGAASTNILGWGLGTTHITVSSRQAGVQVPLTSDAGSLDAGSIRLDENGNGQLTLRSDASPQATVKVASSEWDAEPLTVAFRAPYLFLIAAIAGGLLGAFLRGKGRKKWPRALAIGVATAILLTVGQAVGFTAWITAALGPNTIATSGEAVVFFLGAIAALLGVTFLIPEAARPRRSEPAPAS